MPLTLFVYAKNEWSFLNMLPVLEQSVFNYVRFSGDDIPDNFDPTKFDLAITCEPHIVGWVTIWNKIKKDIKVVAMQQSLYWSDKRNNHAVWPFHTLMIWGQQMKEVMTMYPELNGRYIVTGNPRWDKFFTMPVEDCNFTLVLGSGWELSELEYPESDLPVVFQGHPNTNFHRMPRNTEKLVRTCTNCMFRSTGAGIMPMILHKPVMILKPIYSKHEPWIRSFEKSKLYCTGEFGIDDDFVDWAVGGPGATERVTKFLLEYAKS